LSVANLAARLDALDAGGAFVTEGEANVTVSNLRVATAREVGEQCAALGWAVRIEDAADTEWPLAALDKAYEPFRLIIDKPPVGDGVLRLLTNTGFAAWLGRDDTRADWQIGRLTAEFQTYAVRFAPWNEDDPNHVADTNARRARTLVREIAGQRMVPASMSRWLLVDRDGFQDEDPAAKIWAAFASRMLMLSLPDEFDAEQQALRFKGPPRLILSLPAAAADLFVALGREGFLALQASVDWVFEIEREAEMRHILMSTELARCGGSGDAADAFLKDNIADALAGAKTAYQVQLSGMSSDALKTLSELRKSVSDDTAKVADGTRQIITAVAGALAIGAGLIAARLTGSVNPVLVVAVMALAAIYVAITIFAGVLFTLLQRRVRAAWQPRLYRFLSKPDYDALVGGPAKTAEKALWWSSGLGSAAIVFMAIAIAYVEPQAPSSSVPIPAEQAVQVGNSTPPQLEDTNSGIAAPESEPISNDGEIGNEVSAHNSLHGR
jgi:hypothetical protein